MDIEKELKSLLTDKEYQKLFDYFNCQSLTPIIQENYYYDRQDEILKHKKAGFRLRKFDHSSEWTLKVLKDENISYEYTQKNLERIIPPQKIVQSQITNKEINKYFEENQILLSDLVPTYQIKTDRYIIPLDEAEFCLDKTYFGQHVDYELEFEYQNERDQAKWFDILEKNHIIYKSAPKKIARAAKYHNI